MDNHTAHSDSAPHDVAHSEETFHPGWPTYWKVALILTLITVGEVWMYYVPSIYNSRVFVPALLSLSALKFGIVVAFYMHLKYDHKLFKALFTGPLMIAASTLIALLFLFGKFSGKH